MRWASPENYLFEMTMELRAAEFFAGIGLVRVALEQAGWKVVFANDIAPAKQAIYAANFSSKDFILEDIRNLRGKDIPDIQLATASFPCIDVSLAGKRNGLNGRHSSTYWEFHRILSEMSRRPRAVLLENVVGLLTSDRGQDLRLIISSLNKLGYFCDVLQVNANHFLPQSRPRLFVIGSSERVIAQNSWSLHEARAGAVLEFITTNADLNWQHFPLPPLPPFQQNLSAYVEKIPDRSDLWWNHSRRMHLYSQMSEKHRKLLKTLVAARQYAYLTVYKRVRPEGCRAELRADGVAGCLRTPRGGSSKQFLIEAGRGTWNVRHMTPREYARLQGVADSYRIDVPVNQALLGFGDAVCIPVIEWLLQSCVSQIFARKAVV